MAINVLIADDSAVMRSVISRTLRLSGAPIGDVFTAQNGAECLKILDRHWVDLLFLDINMPVLDGTQVLSTLAKDPVLRDIPVIVVSAQTNKAKAAKVHEKGVRAFIGKPFTPERFLSAVNEALGGIEPDYEQV